MYTVYGLPLTRTFRVLWALEEMGQPYELVRVPPQSPEVRSLNLTGKVPVMTDGDAVIPDSVAIMTYLADKHGQLTEPAGTPARARQDAMTQMLVDDIDGILWTAARHSFILPEDKRVPAVKDSLRWEFARNTKRLGERIEGPFLMGDTMSIADILCVHCLNWAHTAKFEVESDKLLEYAKSLRSRDAFRRVAELAK
jgi:glutathione S-transferase